MRRIMFAAVAGCLALVAVLTLATYFYERPTVMRVAVARDTDDHRLMTTYAQAVSRDRENIRFRVVPEADATASAHALEKGDVDLAVVRTDIEMPSEGQTVVILRKSAALLVAPAGSPITRIGDLKGKRIGVVQPRAAAQANQRILTTILAHYAADDATTERVPLAIEQLPAAFADNRIDAVFAVGPPTGRALADVVAAASAAGIGAPVFIPIADGKALAQGSPAFTPIEVPRGAFGGAEPRPLADLPTIAVGTRLVARSTVADGTVGAVTRALFTTRPIVATTMPLVNLMEAPSTDKDQTLPVHPGAAAYLDGEEETFIEKYSDFIYIGAMLLSVFASAGAALASRLSARSHEHVEDILSQLIELLARCRNADSQLALTALEQEADAILIDAHRTGLLRSLDTHRLSALALALQQVRFALRDRQRGLRQSGRQGRQRLTIAE